MVARVAAIFDLDRTVLRGPSGPAINEALVELGLRERQVLRRGVPLPGLRAVRGEPDRDRCSRVPPPLGVKGWSVDRMAAAGRRAADLLADQVGAYVPSLLDEHRRAGHLLVLATTTPEALVRPLAGGSGSTR